MCARADLNKHGPTAAWLSKILFSDAELPSSADLRPTEQLLALIQLEDGSRAVRSFRWGLVPPWATDLQTSLNTFNARSETAWEKPTFREALRRRRCVIPVDAFFEWSGPKRSRTKMRITMAYGSPVLLAGAWERWRGAGDQCIESCTILTCVPNELLAPIHDRMPVVLAPESVAHWLDPATMRREPLADLQRPHPSEAMRVEVAERPEQLDWTAEDRLG